MKRSGPGPPRDGLREPAGHLGARARCSSAQAWKDAWSDAISSAGPTPLPQTSAIAA